MDLDYLAMSLGKAWAEETLSRYERIGRRIPLLWPGTVRSAALVASRGGADKGDCIAFAKIAKQVNIVAREAWHDLVVNLISPPRRERDD
jgi:hypothetical protein